MLGTWAGTEHENRYLHLLLEKGENDGCVTARQQWNGIKTEIKEDMDRIQQVNVKTRKQEVDAWNSSHAKLSETVGDMGSQIATLEGKMGGMERDLKEVLNLLRVAASTRVISGNPSEEASDT